MKLPILQNSLPVMEQFGERAERNDKGVVLTSPLRVMIPIIKVVGDFCNLRCQYCFYNVRDQSTPHVMSKNLLEKFITEYMNLFSGRLIFIWHGGEPLLAGLDFFKRIVELQHELICDDQQVQNTIQTNATLVDDEWATFFSEHDFRVGVSVDGSEESHDHFRKNHGGGGSFDRVMRGIEVLRDHGVEPGIIQTLTRDNLPRAEEDFSFFADILGVKGWGVNSYLDVEDINQAMLKQSISNEELTEFLKMYIDTWLERDDANLRIREIENFISGVFERRAPNCTFNGSCTGFFCVEYDGRVYPCDRLSNRDDLLFGDMSENPLKEVLNSPNRLEYATRVNSLHPDCAECEWQAACHNGCTMHRSGGVDGKYFYCETRKEVFAHLKEKVEERKEAL